MIQRIKACLMFVLVNLLTRQYQIPMIKAVQVKYITPLNYYLPSYILNHIFTKIPHLYSTTLFYSKSIQIRVLGRGLCY